MVTGKKREENMQVGRHPYGVQGSEVGVDFILCIMNDKWCSQLRSLNRVVDFYFPAFGRCWNGEVVEQGKETIEFYGRIKGEVQQFCYLVEILDSEGGVE